ncbi:hypothetical protein [Roseibium sp.]|uniref:hypothetical protein n=1 Tax=Roseibium sp. TaxID=1936156 RepID=UPI003A97C203
MERVSAKRTPRPAMVVVMFIVTSLMLVAAGTSALTATEGYDFVLPALCLAFAAMVTTTAHIGDHLIRGLARGSVRNAYDLPSRHQA